MSKYSRSMVLGLAVLGLALVAAPVFAANLTTINEVSSEGITGSELFVPTFVSSGDPTGVGGTWTTGGIYIPYLGTMQPCAAAIGGTSTGITGGCARWGQAAVEGWATGVYYDPRFGTPFIPPSGDHHRTGYRMLMQPSFSGGAWLSGFAPLNQRFPFYPEVGTAGPGGDVGLALANASAESGLNGIMALADAHGEPLTTGKFPRYWPHERAAWVDTLMVKYTAGTNGSLPTGDFTQSLRSSVGFSRNATAVRWRAMNNLDGSFSAATGQNSDGCGGPWCEFYVTEDASGTHLWVVKGSDGNTDTADGTPVEITQSTRLDTIGALTNGGLVLKQVTLNDLEKLPTLVEDRLAQTSGDDTLTDFEPMTLISQFRVYSGPNVHSEEGADPYSWVICGSRGGAYGEDDCNVNGGAIDGDGRFFAIVFNSNNQGNLGDSVLKRYGRDLNPVNLDPNQDTGVYVACSNTAGTTVNNGITFNNSTCESQPGADGMYGTADDGTIYYKEALENGLRGWIRETNSHAFSFLGADNDGAHDGISPANFGLTQLVQQATEGFLMSCLNCSPHDLPAVVETVFYSVDWPAVPSILPVNHPPDSGTFTVIP